MAAMPFRLAIPLPGPFYWTPAHKPRRPRATRSRFESPAYWLLGGWVFEAAFWVTAYVVMGCCLVAWWLLRLGLGVIALGVGSAVVYVHNRRRPRGRHHIEGN
jgi:hypothetical protein